MVYTPLIRKQTHTTPDTADTSQQEPIMRQEFLANNGYVVKRLTSQQITVQKPKGKSPVRPIYMAVGATTKPTCTCPVYGTCGHQIAAEEFAAMERRQAVAVAKRPTLEELFAW